MSFREKTCIAILLMVAKWLAPELWAKDIERLSTHISVHLKEQA